MGRLTGQPDHRFRTAARASGSACSPRRRAFSPRAGSGPAPHRDCRSPTTPAASERPGLRGLDPSTACHCSTPLRTVSLSISRNRPSTDAPRRVAVCFRIRVGPPRKWIAKDNKDDVVDRPDCEGRDKPMSELDAQKQGANTPGGIVLGPGEGRTIGGVMLKATGEETGGSIGFIEATTPPRAGPPRHVHYGCDELFYVLEDSSSFWSGSDKLAGHPGRSSSSRGGRSTPQRLSGPSRARYLQPTYLGAKSDPLRSTVSCRATLWPRNTTLSSWDHLYSSAVPSWEDAPHHLTSLEDHGVGVCRKAWQRAGRPSSTSTPYRRYPWGRVSLSCGLAYRSARSHPFSDRL